MTELARVENEPQAIQQFDQANPIAAMLQAVTQKGVTPESAAALEKLTDLYLKMEAVNAKKSFAIAMTALQEDLKPVRATRAVKNSEAKGGGLRYMFAPYEEIMEAVSPHLNKHGFSVKFSQRVETNRIISVCVLTHRDGHSESNEFAVRAGDGPPGCSLAQADGAASTYAKRFALCNALNITIETDTDGRDARIEGSPISRDQIDQWRQRLANIHAPEAPFLKLAGVKTFAEIRTGKAEVLENALRMKEEAFANSHLIEVSAEVDGMTPQERREFLESLAPEVLAAAKKAARTKLGDDAPAHEVRACCVHAKAMLLARK